MIITFILFSLFGTKLWAQELVKHEHCFLSQVAYESSRSTLEVIFKHIVEIDKHKIPLGKVNRHKAALRERSEAYKIILDPDLKMCFSYSAYPIDVARPEKEIAKFREKENEKEIIISERLRSKMVPLKLSPNARIAAHKQYWELNPHLNLLFDPLTNKEIKLRFAKHYHQTEGIVYGLDRLKKNRFLSEDTLLIKAFYLHERLISFEFTLKGKTLKITRGSRGGIDLKEVMNWLENDPRGPVYSFYPTENFDPINTEMIFMGVLETLP